MTKLTWKHSALSAIEISQFYKHNLFIGPGIYIILKLEFITLPRHTGCCSNEDLQYTGIASENVAISICTSVIRSQSFYVSHIWSHGIHMTDKPVSILPNMANRPAHWHQQNETGWCSCPE